MKWCSFYNMWCDEVEENITIEDGEEIYCDAVCDLDCKNCDHMELVKPQH